MFNHLFSIILFLPFSLFTQEDLKNYEKYIPESSCGEIIHYNYYSVSFCEDYKLSEWAIHYLTPDKFGVEKRKNNFRQDPRLKGRDAQESNYYKSGYDKGHLVPAGDMNYNSISMSESNYMTNISPQHASFNRGGWRVLESKIREWVLEFDTVAVITGFVKSSKKEDIIDYTNQVPVPKYFYKVFVDIKYNRSIAFLIPNEKVSKDLFSYVVTIEFLENITGLDFFYKLSNDEESYLELNSLQNLINR